MTNKKIERIHLKGPFGDETSLYNVVFPEGMTVAEFIEAILEKYPKEWGDVKYGWESPVIAEFDHGKIKYGEVYNIVKDKIINEATSIGGWSYMGYELTI